MIQRIQTVYLILAALALVACMCNPIGTLVSSVDGAAGFYNWGVVAGDTLVDGSSWGLLALLILSTIVAVGTIFLYKNRMLQIRLTVFNCILLIGYYIVFTIFTVVLKARLGTEYHLGWALCLPFVALVLNYLAIRAIGKDEVMVKAAERLR